VAAERRPFSAGYHDSHVEAVVNGDLAPDPLVRMVIKDWTKVLFRRFDRIAAKLLPTDLAGGIGPEPMAPTAGVPIRRGAKINRDNL